MCQPLPLPLWLHTVSIMSVWTCKFIVRFLLFIFYLLFYTHNYWLISTSWCTSYLDNLPHDPNVLPRLDSLGLSAVPTVSILPLSSESITSDGTVFRPSFPRLPSQPRSHLHPPPCPLASLSATSPPLCWPVVLSSWAWEGSFHLVFSPETTSSWP